MVDTTETQAEEYATEQPIIRPEETLQEQPLPDIPPRKEVEHPEIEPHIPEEYITDAKNTLRARYATVSEKMGGIEGPDIPDSAVQELASKNYQKDQLLEKQKKEAEPYTEELEERREPVKFEDVKTFVEGDAPEVVRVVSEDELPAVVKEQDIDLSPIIRTPNKSYITSFDELKEKHPEGSVELIGGRIFVRELEYTTGKYKQQPSISYVFLPPLTKVTPHPYEAAVPEYKYDEGKLARLLSNVGKYSIEDQLSTLAPEVDPSVWETINTAPEYKELKQEKVESYLKGFEQEDLAKINMIEEKAFAWARKEKIPLDTRERRAIVLQNYLMVGYDPSNGEYVGLAYTYKGKPINGNEEGLPEDVAEVAGIQYDIGVQGVHQFVKILALRQNYLDYVLNKQGYEREGMSGSIYRPSTKRRLAGPVIQAGAKLLAAFVEDGLPLLVRFGELAAGIPEGLFHTIKEPIVGAFDDPKEGKTIGEGFKEGFSYFDKYVGIKRKPTGKLWNLGEPIVDEKTGKVLYDSLASKWADTFLTDTFAEYGVFHFPFGAYKQPIKELEDRLDTNWQGKKFLGMTLDRDFTLHTLDIRAIQPLTTLEGLTAKGGEIAGHVYGGFRLPFAIYGKYHTTRQAKRIVADIAHLKKTGIQKGTLLPETRLGMGWETYAPKIKRAFVGTAEQEAKYPFTSLSNDFTFGFGMKIMENFVTAAHQLEQKYGGETIALDSGGMKMLLEMVGGVSAIVAKEQFKGRALGPLMDLIVPSLEKGMYIPRTTAAALTKMMEWIDVPVPASRGQRKLYKKIAQSIDENRYYSVADKVRVGKALTQLTKILDKYDPLGKLGNPSIGIILNNTYLHVVGEMMEQAAAKAATKGKMLSKFDLASLRAIDDIKDVLTQREEAMIETLMKWRDEAIKNGANINQVQDLQNLLINGYIDGVRTIKHGLAKDTANIRQFVADYKTAVKDSDYAELSKIVQNLEKKEIKGVATREDYEQLAKNEAFITMKNKSVQDFFLKKNFIKGSTAITVDETGTIFYNSISRKEYKRLQKLFSDKETGAYAKIKGYEDGTLTAVSNEFIVSSLNKIKEIEKKIQIAGKLTGAEKGELGTIALGGDLEKLTVEGIENWAVKNEINNFELLSKRIEDSGILKEKQLEALITANDYKVAKEVLAQAWRDNPAQVAGSKGLEELSALDVSLKKIISFRQGVNNHIDTLLNVGARDQAVAYIALAKTVQNSIKNIKGTQDLKGFAQVNDLYAEHMSIYSDFAVIPMTRLKQGTLLFPKDPQDMVLQWFDPAKMPAGADAAKMYEIFNKMFPKKTIIMGSKGELVEIDNIMRPIAVRKIQRAYESRIMQNRNHKPITKEFLTKLKEKDKNVFERGIGQEFISSQGLTGPKYLDGAINYITKAEKEIEGYLRSNLTTMNKFVVNSNSILDKLKLNNEAELSRFGLLEIEGILGNTQAVDAPKKLLNWMFNAENYKGGDAENMGKLIKYLISKKAAPNKGDAEKNINTLKLMVFDSFYQEVLGGTMARQVFKGKDIEIMQKFINDAGPNLGAFMVKLTMNQKALRKLFDKKHIDNLEDLTAALSVMTSRGRVSLPSGLSGSITDLGILSRFFAIARGVVSIRFIAAELAARSWKDHNTAIMKNLVTDKKAGEIVKKMIVDGKYITPKEQRWMWIYTIRVVAGEGDLELADKLERQYKSGQLFINTFLAPGSEEFKRINKKILGNENGIRLADPSEFDDLKNRIKKQQLLN